MGSHEESCGSYFSSRVSPGFRTTQCSGLLSWSCLGFILLASLRAQLVFTELNMSNDFNVTHCLCRLVGTYLTQIGSSQFPTHKIMFSKRKPASNKHFMQMDMP